MRFLLIEDEPAIRRLYRTVLRRLDHLDVAEAENGREALERLRAERFDVLVLDHDMPELTGLQLLRALEAEPIAPRPWVLFVSGNMPPEIRSAAGVDGILAKPFTPDEFADAVRRLIERRMESGAEAVT